MIADDLGLLITDNTTMLETISKKENEISQLQSDKDMLVKTNGNLLLQVGMGIEETTQSEKQEVKEPFSMRSVFDEEGNFLH